MESYLIKYNDVDLSDMIRVRTVESTVLPPRENNSINIWERQGSIYNGFKYGEREITVSFLVRAMPEDYIDTYGDVYLFMDRRLTDLKTIFNVDEPKPLYLGIDTKYIYAVPEGDFKMEELRYDCYECEVTFVCYDPMYYSTNIVYSDNSENVNTIEVYNAGNTVAYPIINIGVNTSEEQDIGFVQIENITNGNKLLIGQFPSAEKPETVKAGEVELYDAMESKDGWSEKSGAGYIDPGRDAAGTLAITSSNAGLMLGDAGSGNNTWHGACALRKLKEPLSDFLVAIRVTLDSSGQNGDPNKPAMDTNITSTTSTKKEEYYKVTASALNVRSGPGTKNKIIGSLKKGTEVRPQTIEKNWAKIDYNGKVGYCSVSYLKKYTKDGTTTSSAKNVMTNQKAELRSAPDNDSDQSTILATIPKGTALRVHSTTEKDYYKLYAQYNGKIGYVYSSNVTDAENVYVDYSNDEFVQTADDRTGTCEIYGCDIDGNRLFKLAITDDNKYYEFNQPSIRVGGNTILKDNATVGTPNKKPKYSGNEDELTITYDYLLSGAAGSWNDFYGELGIQRKDGKWQAWIYKMDGSTPVKKLEYKEQEIVGAPTGELNHIVIYMGTQDSKKMCGMAISDVRIVTLKDIEPETQNVTQFKLGDELQIDCYNNRVLYNGKLFYDIDIGSQFIELESGNNTIKLTSDDPNLMASILFNERYL